MAGPRYIVEVDEGKENQDQSGDTTPDTSEEPKQQTLDTSSLKSEISDDVSGKIRDEVSKGVISKIGKALGLTPEEEEELPKDPKSLQALVDKRVSEQLSKREEEITKETEASDKEREQRVNSIITSWHTEYAALANAGKVPKIKTPNDPNDPGIKARKNLIKQIGDIIKRDKEANPNSQRVPSISEVLLQNPNALRGPAGADLPISGDSTANESADDFTNKEIRGKSFAEIAREGAMR